ncbi:hypothetical protein IWW37_001567 [Coemansia sp. RSA 2050]|nr:hypothetical protein IWW37_001567 [Coemansia sp. RSA 2050]KAJ2736954.1 hypothetical protein IW152_000465 [Coemansia sp. BCRC 34962]
MANGKGGALGLKKNSNRRSKIHSIDTQRARGTENSTDIGVPDVRRSSGTGTSIPSAGSSGKQAQMVFTIGTFDDDDDSYISDQLRNTAAATSNHTPTRLLGVRGTDQPPSAADSRPLLEGRVDNSELPASWKGAGLTKTSAAQRLNLKRQTLFTMGSHSEASDMDGVDVYNGPPDRSTIAEYRSSSNSSSSVELSGMGDAILTNNSSHDGHAIPKCSVEEQRVPDGSTVIHDDELTASALDPSAANMATHDREACTDSGGGARSSNGSSVAHHDEETRSPNVLHMCKASTSLSQLGKASGSVSSVDAAASSCASDQGSSLAGMPERVASAPAIQPTANTQDRGSCVSFALCANKDTLEASLLGKGKAPLPREGFIKPRKRVGSKKAHLKKAVSTAALRARSRLGGPLRRDPSALRSPAQLGGAAERSEPADCSYVDYSGNSDADEDHYQTDDNAQPAALQAGSPHSQTSSANVVPADPARVSPHSSTATLDGASQDMDDSASTASIDSPRPEQSRVFGTNQLPPSAAATPLDVADTTCPADQLASTTGESYRDRSGSRSPPPLRRSMISGAHAGADLAQTHDATADQLPGRESLVTSTGAAQPPSDQAPQLGQHVQGGTAESRQSRQTDQSRHSSSLRRQGETVVNGGASTSHSMHAALGTKRNMESQRQQSMVEKEEEDLDVASSLLTGIPRRQNRPPGMAPYMYLNPNSPAYGQQVRAMERTYGHVRSMAHPMLESISRCVALREQRLALAAPRNPARVWSSRRMPTEPSETDLQDEWWSSLMPPSQSNSVSIREHRSVPGHSSRSQPTELPQWVLVPDDAKCAVYGPGVCSMSPSNGIHNQLDASCAHVRELRDHAKELKYVRQHAVSAPRNQVLSLPRQPAITHTAELETWRGRRVPGLLNVDIYAGAAGALDPSTRQSNWPGAELRSSPSPEPTSLSRGNPLAPPYRRYGTVYGYTSTTNAWHGQAAGNPAVALGGGSQGSAALSVRGFDGAPTARPSTVGIWDSDPRRSSYFDRLSIDETRPQLASSAAQTTATGLLRRVISGLTGGTTAFGTSQ